jgi:polyribonucleotide nucleotidyltransferase
VVRLDRKHSCTVGSMQLGGRLLSLEVGRIAPLADAAVFAQYGDTCVLVTAVSPAMPAEDAGDGLPLTVDYREKQFASGAIPSTYTRRER